MNSKSSSKSTDTPIKKRRGRKASTTLSQAQETQSSKTSYESENLTKFLEPTSMQNSTNKLFTVATPSLAQLQVDELVERISSDLDQIVKTNPNTVTLVRGFKGFILPDLVSFLYTVTKLQQKSGPSKESLQMFLVMTPELEPFSKVWLQELADTLDSLLSCLDFHLRRLATKSVSSII